MAVGRQNNLPIVARSYEAETTLLLVQFAESRAEIALNAPIAEDMPVLCRYNGLEPSGQRIKFHDANYVGDGCRTFLPVRRWRPSA